MVNDYNVTPLEIGDMVHFRAWNSTNEFKFIGKIISSKNDSGCIAVRYFNSNGIAEETGKVEINVIKMSDEEAMLWKLENV
jgi:hypothetical protein